jgi:hypothetical protein
MHIYHCTLVVTQNTFCSGRREPEKNKLFHYPVTVQGICHCAGYMSLAGKEKLDQEIPLPPEMEEWVNYSEMHHDVQTLEHQQEIETTEISSIDDE